MGKASEADARSEKGAAGRALVRLYGTPPSEEAAVGAEQGRLLVPIPNQVQEMTRGTPDRMRGISEP